MCSIPVHVTAARLHLALLCMAILVKIKLSNNGGRIVCSSCAKWEYLGQGGFNPVKTDCGGGKGKVRATAARGGTQGWQRKLRGTEKGGRTTAPPPAGLNTIFRDIKENRVCNGGGD